ncbi:MAG: preprotein translocase subunit SecY [Candidatus Micrarchaeia archaeon]
MKLDFIKPIIPFIPEVKRPTKAPTVKEKFVWTGIVIFLFFVMYHIIPFGSELKGGASMEFLQVVLASKMGTLLTIGIGPIVLASIILQLFAGAKIIQVDFQNPEDKLNFTATQKTLTIIIAIAEAALFVIPEAYLSCNPAMGGVFCTPPQFEGDTYHFALLGLVLVIAQIAGASILLMFMDEVTSKYGLGSGISIFIAAGVSLAIVQGSLALLLGGKNVPEEITIIWKLTQGGANAIPTAIIALLPIVFTAIIILVCIYAESIKIEIPLTIDRVKVRSMYPLKLLYVSVLPVILTSALLMNVQIISRSVLGGVSCYVSPEQITWLHYIGCVGPGGYVADGMLYFLTSFSSMYNPILSGYDAYLQMIVSSTPLFKIPQIIHIIVYMVLYVSLCVFFGKFWIEAAGMGPETIAEQITQAGLSRPGFRSHPRIIKDMLDKYIVTVAVLGSIFVGLLAVLADLSGAIGTGTGILLTVGIMYKFYEDFKQQKIFDAYPRLNKFFGGSS